MNEIAPPAARPLAEMALAWLLSHEEITTVLIGASKTQQILDNIKAVQNMKFTTEELAEIDRITANRKSLPMGGKVAEAPTEAG